MWKSVKEVKQSKSFWHLRLPSVLPPPWPLLPSPFSLHSSAITTAPAVMPFHLGTFKNRFGNEPHFIQKKKKKILITAKQFGCRKK